MIKRIRKYLIYILIKLFNFDYILINFLSLKLGYQIKPLSLKNINVVDGNLILNIDIEKKLNSTNINDLNLIK